MIISSAGEHLMVNGVPGDRIDAATLVCREFSDEVAIAAPYVDVGI